MANRLKANFFYSKVSGQPKKSSIISNTIINDKAVHSLELANAINQSFLKVAREMDPLPEVHHIPTSIDRDLISSKFYVSIENTVMALNSLLKYQRQQVQMTFPIGFKNLFYPTVRSSNFNLQCFHSRIIRTTAVESG